MRGHLGFAALNRLGNPWVRWLLHSPVHRLASGRLALITVTGRRTGREHTFPVGYRRAGEVVTIEVGWPERKLWWRNLRNGGSRVRLRLAGEDRTGRAHVRGDEESGVAVEVRLDPA